MKPLAGGIKLEGKKDATLTPWSSARPAAPKRVRIPLQLERGVATALVSEGERVRRGQKIAQSAHGFALHASISGQVSEVNAVIEIQSDGKDEPVSDLGKERRHLEALSKTEIRQILKESGVEIPSHFSGHTLILNACESEPYLTSDHSLLMSHPVEILRGLEILRLLLEPQELIIAVEDNKQEVIEVLKSKIFFHTWSKARVEVLAARYPQEDEKILIQSLAKSKEATVLPVWTVYAVYEAVVLQKPFYERIVTIAGECVAQPRNFWIRVGTSVEEAVKYARGFLRKPERILLGGPMRGLALQTLEVPVTKETRGILGLPTEVVVPDETIEPCIRCGRCIDSCPVSISPALISMAAEKEFFEIAQDLDAHLCIECGNCSYVCPAKRPMVELVRYANAH